MECNTVKDALLKIHQLKEGDCLILDIDDTIIMPEAMMFHPCSPFSKFIDDLKKKKHEKLPQILSNWRLRRKIKLVEEDWVEIINLLKSRGVKVIALTAMQSGAFGGISSMEEWRVKELREHGIIFSPFAQNSIEKIIDKENAATLHQGVLFTGSHPKDKVLNGFINKYTKPNKIIFFDDRLEQVQLLHDYCAKANIDYRGYHYTAASKRVYDSAKDRGAFQTKELIETNRWFEDEDIEKNLRK